MNSGRPAVIIGGGIAGATVALALRERGEAARIVQPAAPGGWATGAAAGMISPQYEAPGTGPMFPLGLESRTRYEAFLTRVARLGATPLALHRSGMLVANRSAAEERTAHETTATHRAAGARAEILTGAAAADREPAIGSTARSWLWLPDEGWVDSRCLAAGLGAATRSAGVELAPGRAVGLEERAGRLVGVRLEEGVVPCERAVLAAGAWSARLAGLPRPVPVRPVRGQMLHLRGERLPRGPLVADHAGAYLVPRQDGALAGSTMEEAGFDASTTAEGVEAVRSAVARLAPGAAEARVTERWAGLRPVTPDGLPIIGPDPALEGLYYATGYGRNGILLAPLLGELVADLVIERPPSLDWTGLSIERFSG